MSSTNHRPTVYLAGPVTNLPDLGVGWRKDAAAALEPVGMTPVWPCMLELVASGRRTHDEARWWWEREVRASKRHGAMHPLRYCLGQLERCDITMVYDDGTDSPGTRAEEAYARAIGKVVFRVFGRSLLGGEQLRSDCRFWGNAARRLADYLHRVKVRAEASEATEAPVE